MSFLPGWFPGGALSVLKVRVERVHTPLARTFGGEALQSFTWSAVSFGETADDRIIACAVSARNRASDTAPSISNCSIGGGAATVHQVRQDTADARAGTLAIVWRLVPSGSSGNISFSFSDWTTILLAHAFAVYGASGAPDVVMTPNRAQTQNVSQNTAKGAGIIGLSGVVSNTVIVPVSSWSGLGNILTSQATTGASPFRGYINTGFESELESSETPRSMIATASTWGNPAGHNAITAQFKA